MQTYSFHIVFLSGFLSLSHVAKWDTSENLGLTYFCEPFECVAILFMAMALDGDETKLYFLHFFGFLAVFPHRRRIPPPVDLLELSVGAAAAPFLVIDAWL